MSIKIGVVGSRGFKDYELMRDTLKQHVAAGYVIVSGGAKGADCLAERYAEDHGLEKMVFKAEWRRFGKRAGPIRNKKIVEASHMIIAFWNMKSGGTRHTINFAIEDKKRVLIVPIEAV